MYRLLQLRVCHSELVAGGLASMLAPYADRVRVLPPGRPPIDGVRACVVVCDPHAVVPDEEGSVEHLRRDWQADRLVVLGWAGNADAVERALAAGADGCVGMDLSTEELLGALECLAGTEVVAAGSAHPFGCPVTPPPHPGAWPGYAAGLSLRESQVIGLVAGGLSNERVAQEVCLSINTVKVHLRTAYRTMGVKSRAQAVLWAIDHGFRDSV